MMLTVLDIVEVKGEFKIADMNTRIMFDRLTSSTSGETSAEKSKNVTKIQGELKTADRNTRTMFDRLKSNTLANTPTEKPNKITESTNDEAQIPCEEHSAAKQTSTPRGRTRENLETRELWTFS